MKRGTGFLKGVRIRTFAKGFFGWFNPDNFIDTYQEWHAVVVGFSEVMCPWPARHGPSPENKKDIEDEYHYYVWGRTLGTLAWLAVFSTIKLVLF